MEAQRKEQAEIAWLNGIYNMHAIAAVFAKRHKYPSKPFGFDNDDEDTVSDGARMRERFEIMLANMKPRNQSEVN